MRRSLIPGREGQKQARGVRRQPPRLRHSNQAHLAEKELQVVKRRVGRYTNEFKWMCVERMKQCDDIVALPKELDIDRRLL